jgi:hypothetical protein
MPDAKPTTIVGCPMCGSTDVVQEGPGKFFYFFVGIIGVRVQRAACASCGYVVKRIASAADFREARASPEVRGYFRYQGRRLNWRRAADSNEANAWRAAMTCAAARAAAPGAARSGRERPTTPAAPLNPARENDVDPAR